MSKQVLLSIVLTVLVLAAAAVLWHRTEPASAQSGGAGPYQVAADDENFMLYDAGNGKCWVLLRSATGDKFAWAPVKQLDTESQATNWRLRNPDKN
ncbi:MAG: hypothetical protein SVT52_02040 [Planctomycetota bacterium]|nr:hypothetical protein [Planctomycetota bacterium]